MKNHFSQEHPVEYLILTDPKADGPVIGTYDGHPIAAAVRDCFGRRFTYAGVATRLSSGRYDVTALAPGEWFVQPGLVYRIEAPEPEGLFQRLRKLPPTRH